MSTKFFYKSHPSQLGRNANLSRSTSGVSLCNSKASKSALRIEGNLRLQNILECSNDVLCCQFSADGKHLAVGLKDGMIKVYDSQSGQARYQLADKDCLMSHLPVTQIRFRALNAKQRDDYMNILIASYASGMVKFWHYPTATCLATIDEKRQTLSLELNPDRTKLLTTGSDALIHVYDLETRKLINTCEASDSQQLMDGHRFRVFAAQYHSATQNTFISGGWDNTIQYWDDRNPHAFRHFTGPHICGESLSIDAATNQILTGSWRRTNTLQIWDFITGCRLQDVPQSMTDTSSLYCAQWLGDDSIVSGGSSKNMAQVHNRNTLKVTGKLSNLPKAVYCIDNDRSGVADATIAIGFDCFVYLMKCERTREFEMITSGSGILQAYSTSDL